MDDIQLLREYAEKRSEPAFARLVEQHLDVVYSAALRRVSGDHHRAQEVTQMVFTDLARKASRLTQHPLLIAWLHQSTRWAAASLRRAEQRRLAHEQVAAREQQLGEFSEAAIEWSKISPLLDEALDVLKRQDREAVLLRFFANKPFSEIGEKLGLNENAARMRVERALGKLQSLLTKRGVTSTAAALSLALTQNAVASTPVGIGTSVTAAALNGVALTGGGAAFAFIFMTKFQLALAAAIAIGLSIGLSLQLTKNQHLREELAASRTQIATAHKAHAETQRQIALKETALQQFDAAIAAQTPPLTPEQQERVRLDTLIRKGELDSEYAALFRLLKLSPESLDKLKGLLVERNQAIYDALKLAKSQGMEPASPVEARAIGGSATSEIDRRIAVLLGNSGDARFREFIALQPYRDLTFSLVALDRTSETDFSEILASPGFDDQANALARLLAATAPGYLNERYPADGLPPDLPPEFREALAKVLPPAAMQRYDEETSLNLTRRRMIEIARAAAAQGKLKLSKSSARDYPAPATNQSSATR